MKLHGAVPAMGAFVHRPIKAAVAVILPATFPDECVGINAFTGLSILCRWRSSFSQGCFLVILFQMGGGQGFTKGQFFRVSDA